MAEKTVLVIEDNDLNMKLVRDLLKIDNIKGIEAGEAESGIILARLHRPDLVLMDIELPGMDGLTAVKKIKSDPDIKDIPVIALTAYAMDDDRKKAESAGCDGYIAKPFDLNSFRMTIKKHLGKSSEIKTAEKKRETRNYAAAGSGKKILVVDDDELNLKLLSTQLSLKGYSIYTADNGKAALDIVEKNNPDLILLDIMMPEMDGYEVTSRLKSDPERKNIPIILVTALTGDDDKRKGLDAGADEFINKPINAPELEARIVSLLKLKEYREQLKSRKESQNLMIQECGDVSFTRKKQDNLPSVLVVEDDRKSLNLLTSYLSSMPCNIEVVHTGEEALKVVSEKKIDVMLLDLMLPTMDGFEVCRKVKENEKSYPVQIVMVTGLSDTASKVKGIEAGTDDFLIKPIDRDELQARLMALFKKKAYLDQLLEKVGNAFQVAITDRLTGIYNHGYFKHYLNMEYKRSKRQGHALGLLMIDVDDFKKFNDTYGHPCGDQLLQKVAKIIKDNIREVDFAARYGGEEFAVLLPYVDLNRARTIAERLLGKINSFSCLESAPGVAVSVSIGLSLFPEYAQTPEKLVRSADEALYTAKRRGKNCVSVYKIINHIAA